MTELPGCIAELGPVAQGLWRRLGLQQVQPPRTPEEIQAWFSARGWTCPDEVRQAEASTGGLAHPVIGSTGVAASVLACERGAVLVADADLGRSRRLPSGTAFPYWVWQDPCVWLADDGALWLGSHIDGTEYFSRAFDDVGHYWETLLWLHGEIVTATPPARPLVGRLEAQAMVGEDVADLLGLEAARPGAWVSTEVRAVELDIDGFIAATVVTADDDEGLVLAATAAWSSADHMVLELDHALDVELSGELPPHRHAVDGSTHRYLWGKPSRYRDISYRRAHCG